MPELAQRAGLSDQERMANLIRQCMAPLPTVGVFHGILTPLRKTLCL